MTQKLKRFFKHLFCPHRSWVVVEWFSPEYLKDTWRCRECGLERAYRFDLGPKQQHASLQV